MFLLTVIRWIQSLLPAHLEPSPLTGLANQQTPELLRQIGRSEHQPFCYINCYFENSFAESKIVVCSIVYFTLYAI